MNQWAHNCFLLTAHDPVATITSSGERVNSGDQVTFTCSATGLGANSFKYGWLLNGVPVSRATGQTLVITASDDKSGNYWCTVRNEYGGFGRSSIARLTLSKQTTVSVVYILYYYIP